MKQFELGKTASSTIPFSIVTLNLGHIKNFTFDRKMMEIGTKILNFSKKWQKWQF